jgi:hypothetical protein
MNVPNIHERILPFNMKKNQPEETGSTGQQGTHSIVTEHSV